MNEKGDQRWICPRLQLAHAEIGEVFARMVDADEKAGESGKIKRSELFVTSKVCVRSRVERESSRLELTLSSLLHSRRTWRQTTCALPARTASRISD